METGIPARLTASEGRRFAFPVGLAFLALAGLFFWRGHQTPVLLFGAVSGTLLAAGVLVPAKLGPVYRGWMRFALLLSKVTTPIFMGLTYFLVMLPIGVAMRVLGRNPLSRESLDGSYWVARSEPGSRRSNLTRQF